MHTTPWIRAELGIPESKGSESDRGLSAGRAELLSAPLFWVTCLGRKGHNGSPSSSVAPKARQPPPSVLAVLLQRSGSISHAPASSPSGPSCSPTLGPCLPAVNTPTMTSLPAGSVLTTSLPQLPPYPTLLRSVPSPLCPSRRRPSTVYAPLGHAHVYILQPTRTCAHALAARARLSCSPGPPLGLQAARPLPICTWMNKGALRLNGARTELWVPAAFRSFPPVLRTSGSGTPFARLVAGKRCRRHLGPHPTCSLFSAAPSASETRHRTGPQHLPRAEPRARAVP